MKKTKDCLRDLEEVLLLCFKVSSFLMAVAVVLLVEALGIEKVWNIVSGR